MADITSLFKATIKTVKSRNKQLLAGNDNDKNRILPHSKPKSDFTVKAEELVSSVTRLKEFLLEHRKKYLDVENHLKSDSGAMTDGERDQIDADVQSLMTTCSEAIKLIRIEVSKDNLPHHTREHRDAVVSLLQNYLKGVCKIYSEQRAVRVKRVVDKKRIGRLAPETHHRGLNNGLIKKSSSQESLGSQHSSTTDGEPVDRSTPNSSRPHTSRSKGPSSSVVSPVTSSPTTSNVQHDDDDDGDDDDELSPEEAQMFEEENQQLFDEMNCMVDEVRQIEGKVVEISRLQEIFADKVLEQEADIDRISHLLVGSTENVKEGNEQIREAMKNNAGFRVWILFFLVVCSFSLLFLDWYND